MQAGQRLIANDGYEVALFPLSCLYMTQDEGGNLSHVGTYNLDFIGWNYTADERIYHAPIYAPCTCKLVYRENTYASGNDRVFESVNMVHTPGGLRYIHFKFGHDNNPVATTVGQRFTQGQIIAHTGTYGNVTGDHTHTCMAYGHWVNVQQSYTTRPPQNHQDLTNRIHYWDAVYVNDTPIKVGFGHDWQTWTTPPAPPPLPFEFSGHFPWYIYFRKRRNVLK